MPRLTDDGGEPSWITEAIAKRRRASTRNLTQRRLRTGAIGVAVSAAVAVAAVLVIWQQAPTAEAAEEPTGLQAFGILGFLIGAICFVVFAIVLVVNIVKWTLDRRARPGHDRSP